MRITAFEKGVIAAHRRSGSHLFLQLLRQYRSKYGLNDFTIKHLEIDSPYAKFVYPKDLSEVVHIVRDPRDCLVSCWHYYPKIKRFAGLDIDWLDFPSFIRGKVFEGKQELFEGACGWSMSHTIKESDMQNWDLKMFYDPIEYWKNFVTGWLGRSILARFETMAVHGIPLVGPHKRKGIVGDWKNHMSPEDNDFFWSKAGDVMDYLEYKKE